MTRNSSYRLMVDRARKAGVSMRELYPALASRPADGSEQPGQADCNGVVSTISADGHRSYRPVAGTRGAAS